MSKHEEIRSYVAQFLSKYIVLYSGLSLLLLAIGATISFIVFPDAGKAAFVMITLASLSQGLADFAANLISAEDTRQELARDTKQDELIDKLDDE